MPKKKSTQKGRPHRRWTKAKAEQLADLYAQGAYTVAEICKIVGVSEANFYKQKGNDEKFKQLLKQKEEEFYSRRLELAEKGQKILLEGHKWTEKKTYYGIDRKTKERVVKKIEETEKFILPNPSVVIHALKSLKPEKYKERIDHTTDDKPFEHPPLLIQTRPYDGNSDSEKKD